MPRSPQDAEDPIQAAYGVNPGQASSEEPSLIEEPSPGQLPPVPDGLGVEGHTKWPRAKALAYLAACPKLPVYVPLSRDEEGRAGTFYEFVGWNGWGLSVPKGKTVYAPLPIVEILQQQQERYRTIQAKRALAVDMMLITPDNPGGLLLAEYSDPIAVELARRGAPIRFQD
jgi:hypothetical protein